MVSRLSLLLIGLLATLTGCGREKPENTRSIPPGVSWASLLAEANDLRTLATPVEPSATSKMFSSCLDSNKVILTHLAPQISGDMDHGSFLEVAESTNCVKATLAEFDGPGVVTWVWSANPTSTLDVFIDGQTQSALATPFKAFLDGRFLPTSKPFSALTSYGYNL